MRKKLVAGAAATVLIAGGIAVATTTLATAESPDDFRSVHSALTSASDTADALPKVVLEGDISSELQIETARALGTSDRASYWSVLRNDGALCLVVEASIGNGSVAGTCTDLKSFEEHGMILTTEDVTDANKSFVAYLVPDSAATSRSAGPLASVGNGVFEGALPEAAKASPIEIGTGENVVQLREATVSSIG